jgi:hypothetical protein
MKEYIANRRLLPEGRASLMLSNCKERAKRNKADVTISWDWIVNKLKNGKCELTKLPFDLTPSKKGHANPYAPSLDRINSKNKDYTPENTRVVLHSVNMAINEHELDDILPILKTLVFSLDKTTFE